MHLLSFHRRIVSAGLLLMVIDQIFENCYNFNGHANPARVSTRTNVYAGDFAKSCLCRRMLRIFSATAGTRRMN